MIDLKGKRFGRLTVINYNQLRANNGEYMWHCKCDCGNECDVRGSNLRNGNTLSCGCFQTDRVSQTNSKHKQSNNRIYYEWNNMKNRCYNPNYAEYKNYGGRGISVCEEWLKSFANFYDWAINNGYSDNLTIDRINVNGNYCPDNCRWVTIEAQCNNKRNNRFITYKGKTQTVSQWSKEIGMSEKLLLWRLNHWENLDTVFNKPVNSNLRSCI